MLNLNRLLVRVAVLGLIVGLAAGTYGYTAANALPGSKAGDGTGAVSGYTAANIHYTLNSANPQNLDAVTLTLNVAPVAGSTMKVQLASGGAWYTCTNSGTALTCPTTSPQATAAGATQFTLVVAD